MTDAIPSPASSAASSPASSRVPSPVPSAAPSIEIRDLCKIFGPNPAAHVAAVRDGAIVQKGNSQDILLNPEDAYIRRFIKDVNRGRDIKAMA